MTTKRTIDRHSISAQIAAKREALASATAEYQHQAYLHTQGAPGAAEQRDALTREMSEHERDIAHLEAAQFAAARVATTEDIAASKRLHDQRVKELATLNTEIERVGATLVDRLAALHGPLTELRALIRERGQLAWNIPAALLGATEANKRFRVPLDRLAGEERARSLLLASLQVSGISTAGPSLAPYMQLDAIGYGTPEGALKRMKDQHAELMALVDEAVALAQPITTTTTTTEGAEA